MTRIEHALSAFERQKHLYWDQLATPDARLAYRRRYITNRRLRDNAFRILCSLRSRIRSAIKGAGKSARTAELLGCPIIHFIGHMESKFKPGMSWDNYGAWHVDHIIPCCKFDMAVPEQQLQCFHYTNLQPLWARDNFDKSGTPYDLWLKQPPRPRKVVSEPWY